ncbi:MAG: CoA transferase [Polaromonas sp.]|nr:CoA transferase [Polaromonas sp.]
MLQRDFIEKTLPTHRPRDSKTPVALSGIRVIDFTHYVAGPFASLILADLGADVIKIESPQKGDDFRRYPPHDDALEHQGAPFLWSNRNKRSVALNLKSAEGLDLAKKLLRDADVLIENFSSGVLDRLGLSAKDCLEANPRLVYCSVSAYGREGQFKDRLGFDAIVQAESGFMSLNGYQDREGVRTGASVMDVGAAMMASNAILAALFHRTTSGKGQFVEVALFDTAITMNGYTSMQHLFSGVDAQRYGNTGPDTSPTGVFRASDQPFYVHCGNTAIFDRLFTQVLDRTDISEQPQYREGAGRLAAREHLFALMQDIFQTKPWAHWRELLRAANVPAGEVRTIRQAVHSPEAAERELVSRIPHPQVGWIPNVAIPIRMAATPLANPVRAPALGEHTADVLAQVLGLTTAEIAELASKGAIGAIETSNHPATKEPSHA